jgi:hypothetical protein
MESNERKKRCRFFFFSARFCDITSIAVGLVVFVVCNLGRADGARVDRSTMYNPCPSVVAFSCHLKSATRLSRQVRSLATSSSGAIQSLQKVAIVGGGLAGLSTAFHLLEKRPRNVQITIIDKALVGEAGASSVAGGYVLYMIDVTQLAFRP